MANIKWTGIEQKKYGLTARWYVSAYYGNDTDVDAVGLYDPSTNVTGHGGKERPFATLSKVDQTVNDGSNVVLDSGYYNYESNWTHRNIKIVGDGIVSINSGSLYGASLYNIKIIGGTLLDRIGYGGQATDCLALYTPIVVKSGNTLKNLIAVNCIFSDGYSFGINIENSKFLNCSGHFTPSDSGWVNNIFIYCTNLTFKVSSEKGTLQIIDYSVIIGTVKTSSAINGKTTGVTIEDFKADGNYFVKSYSEVDLFGNASGSGASVAQINEIFNNYYAPIYIDDWQNADFTLKPTADDRVKFGGLNGTYIGAKPVGYRFSASDLWNAHIDGANTSNLEYDTINEAIVLSDGFDVGIYRSVRVSMPEPITVDLVAFMANFIYNIEGTAKQGVANQRIDTTVDLQPDNTLNQRVVYDYRLQVAPNTVDALSTFKNYELNREPTIDADGYSQLDDLFDDATESKQIVQDFIIEFTIRRVIID